MKYKKKENKEIATKQSETPIVDDATCSVASFEASVDTSFFYTSDRILDSFDDSEIILKIQEKYPEFNQSNKDTQLKKIFLAILDDKPFVDDLLEYYQLDILDFFKIIYKQYASLFNALFIKKVKDQIRNNGYAKFYN